MFRVVVAGLLLCVVAASPAAAAHHAAVAEVANVPEPLGRTTADCRLENEWTACGTVFWSLGQWCPGDEVTTFFNLPDDPCLAGCLSTSGNIQIVSGEVGFRVIGDDCNGGYPVTTYAFQGQYLIYGIDVAQSTPDCPVPGADSLCASVVTTIPALTASSSTDPARSYDQTFAFGDPGPDCCISLQPVFGVFRFVSFSVPESLVTDVCDGGQSECAWWYPAIRGRNGNSDQTPCAAACTQYYRNLAIYGNYWFGSVDAGLANFTDFAHWLDVSCFDCNSPVRETTWGKLKSLRN